MNKLLFLVLSGLLAVSTVEAALSDFGPKIQALATTLHATCVPKTGVEEALITRVAKGEFVEDPKIKAYMTCLMTESKLVNEKGEINFTLVKELLPPKVVDESIANAKTCEGRTLSISDPHDRTFNLFKCYHDLNPDLFIFF